MLSKGSVTYVIGWHTTASRVGVTLSGCRSLHLSTILWLYIDVCFFESNSLEWKASKVHRVFLLSTALYVFPHPIPLSPPPLSLSLSFLPAPFSRSLSHPPFLPPSLPAPFLNPPSPIINKSIHHIHTQYIDHHNTFIHTKGDNTHTLCQTRNDSSCHGQHTE